jgi:DNA-binding SARP family transcriptional activator/tetratricopeptide (TPR) repeat protein
MADPYYLKVMGTPGLFDPFGRPLRFKVRKHFGLLIYVVLDGRSTHRRDLLVDLLWPRSSEKGSQSLSMAFSVFRATFGPECVLGKKDIAQFALPDMVTDLQRLERRDLFGSPLDSPLEVDGLLRDFDIAGAPEFQHWVDRKRAELLPAIKAGLLTFIREARRSGDTTAMRNYADRLLDLDHLSEDGVAARMEAFAMQGDRLGALRLFETWKRELLEQLQATPSRDLEGLATRLRKRSLALAESPTAAIVEQEGERPFIGRSAEYRELFEAWEATNQGRSTHVLLTGESGIGKSTLAIRFGSAASLAGAAVARVQCFELEQRIAFGMIGALVAEVLDRPGVAGTAPESLAEVARIVPKVRERFPNLPPPHNTEGEAARLHFAEGTFALFDAIMEEQPIVLIVDDYPRSDEASLSVLHLLLRRAENARLMVILTARPPEPDEPSQAARIRRAMQVLPVRRVQLEALNEVEGDAMLQGILLGTGKLPQAPERRAILRTAAGNPMALELLVRDWLAHPDAPMALLLTAMRSEVTGAALDAEDYDQFIERMLPSLSARHRIALFLAVILGPRLNDFGYFRFLDLTPPQIMAALSELVEYRILRSTERGLEFVNEVMRARLYLNIPVATRVRLHDGVATLLIDAMGRGESVSRLEVAWHCIRAKRRDEAAPHLIIGARQSLAKGAPDEAARALGSALRELKGQTWQEAALLLAEAYDEMGDPKAILEIVGELKATHPSDPSVRELSEELEIDARSKLGLLAPDEAADIVKQFITMFRNRHTHAGRARAALGAAKVARDLWDMDLFDQLQAALARLPTESFEPREKSLTLIAEAMTAFYRRDTETSAHAATLACELMKRSGSQDATLVSLNIGLGVIAIAKGDYKKAIEPFEYAANLAKRLGNERLVVMSAANLAMSHLRLGDYRAQYEWALIARKHRNEKTEPFDRVKSAWLLGMALGYLGMTCDANKALETIQSEIERCETRWVAQFGKYLLADMLWLLGKEGWALEAAIEAGAGEGGPINPALIGLYSRWAALVSTKQGTCEKQFHILSGLREKRNRLDALDRVELDCSIMYLCGKLELDTSSYLEEFRRALDDLPPASTRQLEALGLLNHGRS